MPILVRPEEALAIGSPSVSGALPAGRDRPYDGDVVPDDVRRLQGLLPPGTPPSSDSTEAAERAIALMLITDGDDAPVLAELIKRAVRATNE